MRRFVRIKRPAERPQVANLEHDGRIYRPLFLHSTIDQDRPVGSRVTFSQHTHEFYHIVLYTKGSGWYFRDGRYYPAEPGACILVHPGQSHEFVTRRQTAVYSELTFSYEDNDCRSLSIPFSGLLSLYSGVNLQIAEETRLSADDRQSLYNMLIQITDYLSSTGPVSGYYVHRTLAHIFDFLVEHCAVNISAKEPVDDRFNRVRTWLEEHYLEPVTVEDLSRMAGVTKSYFFRAFKSAFGRPPLAYQQMLRIEAAKTLLRATTLSGGEIALRSGFADVYFFHRVFKKHTGQTPRQFRRTST